MDAQETRIYVAVSLATILIGLLFLYLLFQLYKQLKKNIQLQRQKSLTEIFQLEQERSRIAADLHDELGPLLSSIKFRVNSLSPLNEEDKKEIAVSAGHLDNAIQRLREISNNLLPTALARKGIIEAIQELVDVHAEAGKLKVGFEFSPGINLAQEKRIHVYRMAQEGIYNCFKHAGATRVLLSMKLEKGFLRFIITDNGKGIDASSNTEPKGGRGLISLSNRASIMGGHLHIHSEPGKGTILDFEIPL